MWCHNIFGHYKDPVLALVLSNMFVSLVKSTHFYTIMYLVRTWSLCNEMRWGKCIMGFFSTYPQILRAFLYTKANHWQVWVLHLFIFTKMWQPNDNKVAKAFTTCCFSHNITLEMIWKWNTLSLPLQQMQTSNLVILHLTDWTSNSTVK